MFLFFFRIYPGDSFFFAFHSKTTAEKMRRTRKIEKWGDDLEFLLILRLCRVNLFNAFCFVEAFFFVAE